MRNLEWASPRSDPQVTLHQAEYMVSPFTKNDAVVFW